MPTDTPDVRVIAHLAGRIFPRSVPPQVERVTEGVSTYVYRIRLAGLNEGAARPRGWKQNTRPPGLFSVNIWSATSLL